MLQLVTLNQLMHFPLDKFKKIIYLLKYWKNISNFNLNLNLYLFLGFFSTMRLYEFIGEDKGMSGVRVGVERGKVLRYRVRLIQDDRKSTWISMKGNVR